MCHDRLHGQIDQDFLRVVQMIGRILFMGVKIIKELPTMLSWSRMKFQKYSWSQLQFHGFWCSITLVKWIERFNISVAFWSRVVKLFFCRSNTYKIYQVTYIYIIIPISIRKAIHSLSGQEAQACRSNCLTYFLTEQVQSHYLIVSGICWLEVSKLDYNLKIWILFQNSVWLLGWADFLEVPFHRSACNWRLFFLICNP